MVSPSIVFFSTLLSLLAALPYPASAIDTRDMPALDSFLDKMVEDHGFARNRLESLFDEVEIKPEIVELMDKPRERVPWHEYRELFITVPSAKRGARFWRKHHHALAMAEQRYGVPPEIVLGIIGVESQYGLNRGQFRIIDALSTLAFHYPRRSSFFLRELESYLLLTRELEMDPLEFTGSYAGAMGLPQFLPSSYRAYAVDFDEDGTANLLTSPDDAIFSVANYFRIHGWRRDEPVISEAEIDREIPEWIMQRGLKPSLKLSHLLYYGIRPRSPVSSDEDASLITFKGEKGPIYRLGFHNFYVITRYNRSSNYAMAVYELGQLIKKYRYRK